MAEIEETPSQRQARIRREKREAKIKAEGDERLNKITKLSGRSPETVQKEYTNPTLPATTPQTIPSAQQPQPLPNATDPSQAQMQEAYLRNLLRTSNEQEKKDEQPEDPMEKMLNSIMGMMGQDGKPGDVPFSPEDVSKATGLPPFLTDMLFGKTPPTPAQEKTARIWKMIHLVFAFLAGAYLLYVVDYSTRIFGDNPPAPATLQNPFLIFITGELLIESSRLATADQRTRTDKFAWFSILKDVSRDGCVVVFMMGIASYMKSWT